MDIKFTGTRHDVDEFFVLSGILRWKELSHTPLIVFLPTPEGVEVRVIVKVKELYDVKTYPDDTRIMAQWKGNWRSDFFDFTAGQFRAARAAQDARLTDFGPS